VATARVIHLAANGIDEGDHLTQNKRLKFKLSGAEGR
jgi:hypothetical protein